MTAARRIGILGGAGVAASAELVRRIVDLVTEQGARFDQEHPEVILIQATQAPSRSLWLEGRGPSFVPSYVETATRLRQAGAGIVAMCCNTAHAAHAEIAAAADVQLLDLIELSVAEALVLAKGRPVGILSSSGTRLAGLYHKALAAAAPASVLLESDEAGQARVTEGIVAVKRGRRHGTAAAPGPDRLFAEAADDLVTRGAGVVILGCTEIPLAFPPDWTAAPTVDTIDVLARACLRWWANGEA